MEVLKSEKNDDLDNKSVGKHLNFTMGSTKTTVYYQ